MSKMKFDGVLEAAHFDSQGQLVWVRVYERRYAAFTDRVILSREEFIKQLTAGKRYMLGERVLNLGGIFNVSQPVHLFQTDGKELIVVGNSHATTRDELSNVPVI